MIFNTKKMKQLSVACLFFVVISIFTTPIIYAANGVPSSISYHGNLTDTGGNPLGGVGTQYYFRFSFWDSPTVGSGIKVWPLTSPGSMPLTVKQGVFNVDIGDVSAGYPDVLDYNFNNNKSVYLQIEISSDNSNFETLGPRSPITSAPFSQVSGQVNGTNQSSFGTTTPIANSVITAISTAINSAVMTIRGIAGQVANLFNVQDSSGNSLFSVSANGNVGIGTSTPNSSLSVAGTANFTGLTTFGGGLNLNSQTFNSLLGSGLSNVSGSLTVSTSTVRNFISSLGAGLSYNSSTGAFTNTGVTALGGTANQVSVSNMTGTVTLSLPQDIATNSSPTFASTSLSNFTLGSIPFFGAGGVLSQNNSKLFWDNTNGRLGIGTTTPGSMLDVWGNLNVGTSSLPALSVNTALTNVGIGMVAGGNALSVKGQGNYDGITVYSPSPNNDGAAFIGLNGARTGAIQLRQFGVTKISLFANASSSINTGYGLGVGTSTPGSMLDVWGNLNVATGSIPTLFANTGTGNVGIGTNSPGYQLNVVGTGLATDGIGISSSAYTSIPYPGSANNTPIILNARGFSMTTDSYSLSSSYQPQLGIGLAGNRPVMLGIKASATGAAIAIEQGRIGVGTPTPAQSIDAYGVIRARSNSGSGFDTTIDLVGQDYNGGNNYASGGLEVNGAKAGVGMGFIGSTRFYSGADTDATRGWAWNSNGSLGTTTLGLSGAQMVLNRSGLLGIGTSNPFSTTDIVRTSNGNALTLRNNLSGSTNNVAMRFSLADSTVNTDNYNKAGLFFIGDGGGSGLGNLQFALNNATGSANVSTSDTVMTLLRTGNDLKEWLLQVMEVLESVTHLPRINLMLREVVLLIHLM